MRSSIERLCGAIDQHVARTGCRLLGIGFIAPDDMLVVAAFLLYEGDLPSDAEPYQYLSPVEWTFSDGPSFDELNQFMGASRPSWPEPKEDYVARVRQVFDTCAEVLESMGFRKRYSSDVYITFAGVDPNDVLVAEEKRFVERMNSPSVFAAWCEEW